MTGDLPEALRSAVGRRRRLIGAAFVLVATAIGAALLTLPGVSAQVVPPTTEPPTSEPPTTTPPPTDPPPTTPPPTEPPPTTPPPTSPVTAPPPPPTGPPATARPSSSAVNPAGRLRRTTTTAARAFRAATTSTVVPGTVDAGAALAPLDTVPSPASTVVEPPSSTTPRRAAARPEGAPASQSRRRPLALLWWPGALAVALGALSIVGARRARPESVPVEPDATARQDVLVDLDAAEREAHAPAERMAVQLERLRSTAPPVTGRRGHR